MSTIPALSFVVFYVSDIEEATTYFTEKLGFAIVPEQSGKIFRALRGGEENIGYGLNLVGEDTPPAGTVELYFQADDINELHTTLTARGAGTTPVVRMPFGSIFGVQSPDKHPLVMLQQPAR